tara:strand:- start:1119 stop:2309 length:1191 start_codon:yes stop_codon:yes gene_type:complete
MLVQVNRVGGGILAPALAKTHFLSPGTVGIVIGIMFFASAAVQLPVGLMLDRFGARRMLVGLSAIAILGMLLFGMAQGPAGLVIGRILIGIGHGASITGIYLLALAWASPERVATVAATTIGIGGALGGIVGTAPLALSIEAFGLNITFIILAALSAVVSVIIWWLVDDRPVPQAVSQNNESIVAIVYGFWEVLKDRNLRPIFAMALCFSVPFAAIGGLWAGPFLRDIHVLSPATAGSVILVMAFCVNIGTFIYGPLDRIFNTRKWVVVAGVMIMIISLLSLSVWPNGPLLLVASILGIFSLASPIFVTLASHCRSYVHESRAGRVLAIINFLGVGFIFVMQGITGWLFEVMMASGFSLLFGYRLIFLLVAAVLTLCCIAYLFSRDIVPNIDSTED